MTTSRTAAPTPAAVPRALLELLLDLGLCLQRYAMYPGGHPTVDSAIMRLATRLEDVLRERDVVSLGVARRQLIVESAATDPEHPVLRAVAERLYRHRLGAVVFRRGVDAAQLSSALAAIASDPERSQPLGSGSTEQLTAWPHVRFYRVTYEQLQMRAAELDGAQAEAPRGTAANDLWLGLARAALSKGEEGGDEGDAGTADADVAGAINVHAASGAYDGMIVDYMVQLASELRRDGAGAEVVRRRMSAMIRELDPATLQRLLEMGGDAAQRRRLLRDMSECLRPEAVLEVVRAAARAEGQDISTSMLRLLRKLSRHAEGVEAEPGERAEAELRAQVRELIDGWSLADPNPDAYTQALDAMAGSALDDDDVADATHGAEPLRIVQMGVEVEATGLTFWRAVDAALEAGQLSALLDVMEATGSANHTVAVLWRRIESADHIRHLLTTDPIDFESLDRIFARLPAGTIISLLLDRLSESTSRSTRMGLFKRLSARGYAAVPMVAERLADARWFVLRNMLALLGEIGAWPQGFSALTYARHGQPMVRREALLLGTRIPAERAQAIRLALSDRDERVMRVGVNACAEGGVAAGTLPVIIERVADDSLSSELRVQLIRLLARHVTAPAVARLVELILYETRLLGRPKLAARSPEMLAALSVLAGSRSTDPRARTALELARVSPDAAIRTAAGAA